MTTQGLPSATTWHRFMMAVYGGHMGFFLAECQEDDVLRDATGRIVNLEAALTAEREKVRKLREAIWGMMASPLSIGVPAVRRAYFETADKEG